MAAALHPETVRLLRKALDDTNAQHKTDLARLAKMHIESKSLMAQKLRTRIASSVLVMRDLETLAPSDTPPAPTELQAAYRVLGHVMETVPTSFTACGWDIDIRYTTGTRIKIQQSLVVHTAEVVRQSIRSVAAVLGLTYGEDRQVGRIRIHAVGEIDGIRVEIWDALDRDGGESL